MRELKTHNLIISPSQKPIISRSILFSKSNLLHNFKPCTTKPISCSSSSSSSTYTDLSTLTSSASSTTTSTQPTSFVDCKAPPAKFATEFSLPQSVEEAIEKAIYRCRFVTLLGVFGSLIGSLLCFIKGCNIVASSFIEHAARSGKTMVLLVEATDVYLLGTVMMVFGMGLYELFVSNLDIAESQSEGKGPHRSNLFGLFTLRERPKWLEINSVNELKTKVGHVIVMLLLIGLLDNTKKAAINTPTDLLCFSASVLLCSGGLYLLSKLNGSN